MLQEDSSRRLRRVDANAVLGDDRAGRLILLELLAHKGNHSGERRLLRHLHRFKRQARIRGERDLELDLQTGGIGNDRVSAGIYGRLQEHAYLATGGLRLRHIVPGLRPRAFCHELPSDEVS